MSESAPAPHPGEEVRWTGTVSNLHYAGKWFLAFFLVAIAIGSIWFDLPAYEKYLWAARAGMVILAFLIVGWIQLDRSRRKYVVTTKRVSLEYGIVSKTSNEIRIQDIRSINLSKHGLSGLLGIGRVEFASAASDDADVIFWNTPDAEKVRDLVRSLQN